MDPFSRDVIIDKSFVRYSQIYKDNKGKWLKKVCQIKLRKWDSTGPRQVAEIEVDMAPFIGKAECREKVRFPKCEVNNAMIEIEFKLVETEGNQGADDSGDEETKDTTPTTRESHATTTSSSVDTKHFEDEISSLKQQLAQLKRESSDFQLKS